MSGEAGSPGQARRRRVPAAPLQLFPTSYVDLDLPATTSSPPLAADSTLAAPSPSAGGTPTTAPLAPATASHHHHHDVLHSPTVAGTAPAAFGYPSSAAIPTASPLSPPGSGYAPSALNYLAPSSIPSISSPSGFHLGASAPAATIRPYQTASPAGGHQYLAPGVPTPPASSYSPAATTMTTPVVPTFLVPSPSLSAPSSTDGAGAPHIFSPRPYSQTHHGGGGGGGMHPAASALSPPSSTYAGFGATPEYGTPLAHAQVPPQYEPVFEDTPQQQRGPLGAGDYEPIFEDDVPTTRRSDSSDIAQSKQRTEDDDDDLGLYNKPKRPAPPPTEVAGGDESASLSSYFANSSSSLRQRRGTSSTEKDKTSSLDTRVNDDKGSRQSQGATAQKKRLTTTSKPSSAWHWPWLARVASVLLLSYCGAVIYRCYVQNGLEGLVDTIFNLQLFVLLAAVGMMTLSRNLIGTSLVMLSYYHFSWWADIVFWSFTGKFYFGTGASIAGITRDTLSSNIFDSADLLYHALFVPLCFLVLYKNGGVTWRAGFLSVILHSLLFSISTTHQLPVPIPSLNTYAPFAYRTAYLYELGYNRPNSPPYRLFMQAAPKQLKRLADSVMPLLVSQGIQLNVERTKGGGIALPPWIYAILFIALCNMAAFVLLKLLSFLFLQRPNVTTSKSKAE